VVQTIQAGAGGMERLNLKRYARSLGNAQDAATSLEVVVLYGMVRHLISYWCVASEDLHLETIIRRIGNCA
jgi:hypothetical protein